MSYRQVNLIELRDAVFFGQTKVFSDAQRALCPSIDLNIKSGALAVLEETPMGIPVGNPGRQFVPMNPPKVIEAAPIAPPAPAMDMNAMAALVIDAVSSKLEGMMSAKSAEKAPEAAPAAAPAAPAEDTATVKALEALSKKLDNLSVSGAGVTETRVMPSHENKRVEDVYIPSIRVDDMANHVQLETRSLGQGGQVNAALAELRGLKKSQG